MVLLYGGYYFRQGQKFKGYLKWENIAIGFVCILILAVAATPNQPLTHINRESPVVPPQLFSLQYASERRAVHDNDGQDPHCFV